MKRWPPVIAALALALTLVSCDAMFESNIFAAATHEELSASSFDNKTPDEIQTLVSSTVYVEQLAKPENADIKDAALAVLAGSYSTLTTTVTAEGQVAAITAAEILIKTDANAAAFVSAAPGAFQSLSGLSGSTDAVGAVTDTVKSILPVAISSEIAPGASMPAGFAQMIDTFAAANSVFQALGDSVSGDAYVATVDSSQALSVAVNAAVSAVVSSIDPASGTGTTAEAIWNALCDPDQAADYIAFDSGVMDATYLTNLFGAADFNL